MSISYRRYEILPPRRFNDGEAIPGRQLTEAILELRERFGGVSCDTQIVRGEWEQGGDVYRDELLRGFVDVEDTAENRDFFRAFRDRLKTRFRQVAVWMTRHVIEVL
jgi:hypothetical protein